ncbi:MAG TPA: aldehyde dehydrogenase family protein [Candidatus Dormibacteraeota bacterium]
MRTRDALYIDGRWTPSSGDRTVKIVNPATEAVFATVPEATAEDVDRAVRAARGAFPQWSTTTVDTRTELLTRLRDALAGRQEEIATTVSAEMGAPMTVARQVQAGLPLAVLGSYVGLLPSQPFEETIGNSLVIREPVGVVGAITPWNYPLHQIMCKVAPALAAGCTVVLKPSELAPLSAFLLADAAADAGLPAGVLNVVSGTGSAGEAITAHPDVDMISFTGSVRTGRRIGEVAAATVKRVTLELGGKSANVILSDVDGDQLRRVVESGLYYAFFNSGQTCTAWTRMVVPAALHEEVLSLAASACESYSTGDPRDEATRLGPLVSGPQRERVRRYIRTGIEEGARMVVGGKEPPDGLARGFYVRPTIFGDVTSSMTVAQEEIFGPVLCVLSYADEEEALSIANDTIYGLSGGVWSADTEHAVAFARRMRTGQVTVNGGKYNVQAPFGGVKQSGHGRELGLYGLAEYLDTKSLQL